MPNQKKGFVMYFDSLGLLNLFPPDQIGELLLALYDYAQRICHQEETPEEALFRYPMLTAATQVGFCSIAWHILRDTRTWKGRQASCRQAAQERLQKQQAAQQPKQEQPTPQQRQTPGDLRQEPPARTPNPTQQESPARTPFPSQQESPARTPRYSQQRQEPPARAARSQQPCIPEAEMARYVRAFHDPARRSRREQDEEESPYSK